MSCFIMSDQAHAATANALEYILNSGFNRFGFDAPDSLYKALSDCRDRYGFYCSGLIFRRLYDLNSRAYAGATRPPPPPRRRRCPASRRWYKSGSARTSTKSCCRGTTSSPS